MADLGRRRLALGGAVATLILALGAGPLRAQAQTAGQQRQLSLAEALRMAEAESEQLLISRAGVTRARGEQLRARSERLPQLNATAGYTRALASEFQPAGGGRDTATAPPPEPCTRYTPNPALPLPERVDSLEKAVECAANANPFAAFGDLPFGRENTYRVGLSLSQNLFAGGRITAQNRIADAGRATAEIGEASSRAQLALDVAQAYYDAALSERLVEIATATLEQAEDALRQVQVARRVGSQPEFELLRAQVTRDNARPVLIQRQSERDLALLRLKQLLNLPLDQPLSLVTPLGDDDPLPVVGRFASRELSETADTATAQRAPVRQAAEAVRVQEGLLRVARSQRLPGLALVSQYGRVGYPEGTLPDLGDFRTNWTVGLSLSVPIFTGGRIRGDELVAEANLAEAQARFQQTRELTALDTRDALTRLEAAQASWEASAGTAEQANRAYTIAQVRFREGISTQLELTDSRILLQQAQANRALAARDLQLARIRLALLRDLPLGAGGPAGQSAQQQQNQQSQQRSQQQAPRQSAAALDPTQALTGAGVP